MVDPAPTKKPWGGTQVTRSDYRESRFLRASDKRKALEETMALSTQSLASVTYQVSSLASTFLQLLDLQAAQLRKVEAEIGCVAQRVEMHKEKVSRREIGSLTISKRFPPYQKIISPPSPPSLEPYYRKPLNFSALDDIGHGIKKDNELSFPPGTLLFVTRRYSDGWLLTLYPYTRQKDNELSFPPGTLLFVTRRYSDGWCEGVMAEAAGFFPGNYVEPF
ncbi:PREDICTED: ABI gene family member 3 [Chaetura pelagica]|uniref:ABI gene family member 3 n=1 Tax=Chaetura pelagica TaxID=8897 RepID=UPI00052314AD|nr:PREDICTED: ABI gene family member 3 [Chaetura pelagica]